MDPGADLDWGRTEQNPAMLAQLQLQEGERLGLLREYLDLVQVHSTAVESSFPAPARCRFLPASSTPSTSVSPVPALRY